jgi:L-ascorbate metabolism protein UlaG (beta-lactamase superfamily)
LASVAVWLQQAEWGHAPDEHSLPAIQKSIHQTDGEFRNTIPTPMLAEGQSQPAVIWASLTQRAERLVPAQALPSVKTNLHALPLARDVVVWLGHSSYYLHIGGQRVLIDPVLSPFAAPVSFANRAFPGSSPYRAEDIPDIDLLLITHDHYDHLDHATLTALRPRIAQTITGLGVGAHLRHWGFAPESVREGDWLQHFELAQGLAVHVLPARHYSGRTFTRNRSLWVGFALTAPGRRLFFSGDSGYGPHFADIGQRLGGFDLAVLDSGQYDARWPFIHMTPEEAVRATVDLRAAALLPGHVGKFAMANHAWDEPFRRVDAASRAQGLRLLTPMLGEPVRLDPPDQTFAAWWAGLR